MESSENNTKTVMLCICLGDPGVAKMLLSGY